MRIRQPLRAAGAALACIFLPTAAFAVSQDINLSADVAAECTLNGSDTPAAIAQAISVSAGQPSTTPITITVPVSCNTNTETYLSTTNAGLRGPAQIDGLSNRINYIANVAAPGMASWTIDTETAEPGVVSGGLLSTSAPHDIMTITITPKTNSIPLRNGTYTDTLRVTLTIPQ